MAKERITVTIADVKMNLRTAEPDAVKRMAESLNLRVNRICERTGCEKNHALVMIIMEQAEAQKRCAELIHEQQEQIFELVSKNSALIGQSAEIAPIERTENALMREISQLKQKNLELLDVLVALREMDIGK